MLPQILAWSMNLGLSTPYIQNPASRIAKIIWRNWPASKSSALTPYIQHILTDIEPADTDTEIGKRCLLRGPGSQNLG